MRGEGWCGVGTLQACSCTRQSDELAVGKVWREGLLSMSRSFVWSVAKVVRDWESVRVVVGRISGSLHLLARC